MIICNVTSEIEPRKVTREALPDGRVLVRLAQGAVFAESDEGGAWVYDEAVFDLPDGRGDSAAEIEADFDAWWAYAGAEHSEPTLEQRVSDLEDAFVALLGEV